MREMRVYVIKRPVSGFLKARAGLRDIGPPRFEWTGHVLIDVGELLVSGVLGNNDRRPAAVKIAIS